MDVEFNFLEEFDFVNKNFKKRGALLLMSLLAVFGWSYFQPKIPSFFHGTVDKIKYEDQNKKPLNHVPILTPEAVVVESQLIQPYARTPYLGLTDPRWIEHKSLYDKDPSYQWRMPIKLFGEVIDEKQRPVVDANIEYSWSGTIEKNGGDGIGHSSTLSDSKGKFVIRGIEGKVMSVRAGKVGYYSLKTLTDGRFEYADFWDSTFIEASLNHPVIFRLVKRPVAEPTYRIGERVFLQPPALEGYFDLLSPILQSEATADIYIRFTRSPNASYEKPFDWTVAVEGRNGSEIAETTDEFMIQAPLNGYTAKFFRKYTQASGNARQSIRFYVRSTARGFYAAVKLEMAAYRQIKGTEPASVIISATVNPNNSPNVEYNPEKNLKRR